MSVNIKIGLIWRTVDDVIGMMYPVMIAGLARYIKVVDTNEMTILFVQEIYNGEGKLVAIHQKYPVDTGHQWLDEEVENNDHT
ncbi:hypothetical protein ACFLYO_03390 [Chloroflexota bacterium]